MIFCSESHFTDKTYFKIKDYDSVFANHPDNRAHAGAAILIKSHIKYEIVNRIEKTYIQSAGIKITCDNTSVNIFSIYSPPRHNIKCEQYEDFSEQLGSKLGSKLGVISMPKILGGDHV